jgi:hypothetical protein
MRRLPLLGAALCCLSPALAIERKLTVSLERLYGFEPHVAAAAREVKLPASLTGPGSGADFRIYLSPRFPSSAARLLYWKSTGRTEDSILELYCPRTKRTRVTHEFSLPPGEDGRRRAALEFMLKVKDHLTNP